MEKIVFVHGFWHGSWCWSLLTEDLAGRGVASVAVDLEGHGLRAPLPASAGNRPFDPAAFATEPSGVAEVTTTSAAVSLVRQLRRIGGGQPCLVVAHSMGGTVATAAAELAPELFGHLVYVAAFAPVSGQPAVSYLSLPENQGEMISPLLAADPAVVGALRIDTADLSRRGAVREAFYNDVDEATANAAIALLTPDAPGGMMLEAFDVTTQRYGTVPHTYVVCSRDNTVPAALQRRFVSEIDAVSQAPTNVVELDSSHSPFLSQPTALADVVFSLA